MAGVYAPHSDITAIDRSSSTAAAAARRTARPAAPQHAGPLPADHLQRAVETLRCPRITAGGRSRPPGGAAAQKPLDFSNGFEKILIGFLKSFWKVWKNFGAGFALR